MKSYTITINRQSKQVAAKSYLEALMDEAAFLKSGGKNKFTIEVSNKETKLGIYVRA